MKETEYVYFGKITSREIIDIELDSALKYMNSTQAIAAHLEAE